MRANKSSVLDRISNKIECFLTEDSGATAMEYAMIAALISIAIIAGVSQIGTSTSEKMSSVTDTLNGE